MFRAAAGGKTLHFANAGVRGGNEVYRDAETGSRWQQSTASAISGPLAGTHLDLYPYLLTSWGEWRRLHPHTLVLQPLPGYAERLAAVNRILRQGIVASAGSAPKGLLGSDTRLPPRTTVVGLEQGGEAKAYPIAALNRSPVVNDRVGGVAVVIVHQPASDTTTAFLATVSGRRLHFRAASAGGLTDLETHSRWNDYGRCVSGSLHGAQLPPIILESEFWFAWYEFHPATRLYASAGPKPGRQQ